MDARIYAVVAAASDYSLLLHPFAHQLPPDTKHQTSEQSHSNSWLI